MILGWGGREGWVREMSRGVDVEMGRWIWGPMARSGGREVGRSGERVASVDWWMDRWWVALPSN